MRYDEWAKLLSVENEFRRALKKLVKIFADLAEESEGDTAEYQKKMSAFQQSSAFKRYINATVRRMVVGTNGARNHTWRAAARKAMKGDRVYKLFRESFSAVQKEMISKQVEENARLIRTLPEDVAGKVTRNIADLALRGMRSAEIAKKLKHYTEKHSRASINLIARTETSKTSTALTRVRSEALGVRGYIWRTALDGLRVRKSHRIMEGVLVFWDNPPSPELLVGEKYVGRYHAGEIWNCRCYPEPVIDLDDLHFPVKVYLHNTIQKMSKVELERLL